MNMHKTEDENQNQIIALDDDMRVNLQAYEVMFKDRRVHLTRMQFSVLEALILNAGTTVSKNKFMQILYAHLPLPPEIKVIDVLICHVRKRLANASEGRNYIDTIWGRGYTMRLPEAGLSTVRALHRLAAQGMPAPAILEKPQLKAAKRLSPKIG